MHKHCFLPLLVLFLTLICSFASAAGFGQDGLSLYFINVKKGDSCLITTGDSAWLIDTGKKENYETLASVLQKAGIDHLNGILISHGDKDHCGSLNKLLKSGIAVDTLYSSALYCLENENTHPVAKAAEKYGIPHILLSCGDSVPINDDCGFKVIGPIRKDEYNEDNNSLVLILETSYGKVMFPGDMGTQEEQDLLTAGVLERCDVLKVAHHGKNDATGKAFTLIVKPQIAVISNDSGDEPDGAHPSIIQRLWNVGAEVYITQNTEYAYLVQMEETGITVKEME